ncbi:hypothetical protein KAR91_51640, partial [Candidatus Pacearchaeota archaeon]|nr:hypothetical protein [Candidatus Pacearchaeota archaeon]
MVNLKEALVVALVVGILVLVTGFTSAANWQSDPSNCPVEYNSVSCTGGDLQCGIDGASGGPYCYDMSSLVPPSSSASSSSLFSGSYNGGYLVNCEATDAGEPYCDNSESFWCNRDSSCDDVGRETDCTADAWETFTCGSCQSDYNYCDGSYVDGDGCEIAIGGDCGNDTGTYASTCDGASGNCTATTNYDCNDDDGDSNLATCNGADGCEISEGGACTVGSLSGTYSGCSCVVSKSTYETGTFIEYLVDAASGSMLWFKNFGDGWLINATNNLGETWGVNNNSCMVLKDGTEVCDASDLGSGGTYNATYDAHVQNNDSWNQSYADGLYSPIGGGGNLSWNQTLADGLYADISVVTDNSSWSQVLADSLYYGNGDNAVFSGLNVSGLSNFGENWQDGGVTITNGNIFAQALYVFNISSVAVSSLQINGSIVPGLLWTDTFDLGSSSERWKDGYFSSDVIIDGVSVYDTMFDTYNATYAALVTDNSSWNQALADGLYADISLVG